MTDSEKSGEGRLLAVGDIHGCLDMLRKLLEIMAVGDLDRVVFLGDYIDRGPDSRGVIDYLLDFRERYPQTVFLKGNHEAMLLDYLAGHERLRYLLNGGETTLAHYRREGALQLPIQHRRFLDTLRPYFETDHFIFAHAGLRPGMALQNQQESDLLWIRDAFLKSDYSWGKCVVFGHTPLGSPLLRKERIGLDTGAVYGGTLSGCDVVRRQIWQVQAPRKE